MNLETLAEQAQVDSRRARQLERALAWIGQCRDGVNPSECYVEITIKFGSGVTGYTDATDLMSKIVVAKLPALIDEAANAATAEFEAIIERYRPILDISQGNPS